MKHKEWVDNIIYLLDGIKLDSLQEVLVKTKRKTIIADSDQIFKGTD